MHQADAEAYWSLRLRALSEHPEAFGSSPEEHPSLADVAAAFENRWQSDEHYLVGAFIENNLVGTVRFARDTGHKVRHKGGVFGMYVVSEARGRGVGRALLEDILSRAQKLVGLEQLYLSVTEQNTAAKTLYLSYGFSVYATEPHALKLGSRYLNELHLIRYLTN